MSDNEQGASNGDSQNFEELQRMLRDMLSGAEGPSVAFDVSEFAKMAGIQGDPQALHGLLSTLRAAMQHPSEGIDWSIARRSAIEVASTGAASEDPATAQRAFSVATLWLDEVTSLGATPDAPRTLNRIEWVQQSIETWISLAEPIAESVTRALMNAMESQMPEEFETALQGATPMLRSIGGALFAMQLGSIVGKLSGEVVSAGDIGIPLLSGAGREGGALLPSGVAAFADGLEQDTETVTLYLALRELAHARLFRHSKWLRLHLLTAIGDFARGVSIDTDRIETITREIDPSQPEQIKELLSSGSLIPPRTPLQEAAHARLETMLALIEGWVDVVTADAAKRIPGADAIAEMVRRRRATGGPAEHAFASLVGLELRPRRLREAAAMWRLVANNSSIETRDRVWEHPDLLPIAEEIENPELLLKRLGLRAEQNNEGEDAFEASLVKLLNGELPAHESDEDLPNETT